MLKPLPNNMSPGDPALPTEPARWSIDELIPFGKYILLNKISSGATAAVYRAKIRGEAGFERLLTIKRILPQMAGDQDFVETFIEEAKICARLNHSSICPTYELGKVGESLYLAMEWIAGKDLGALTRRLEYSGKVMPPLIASWIAGRLCDALDYAHALKDVAGKPIGIVHQDLSPSNIVLSYEGQVKLIDFGLAKAAGRAQQTNVDALKQKIGYMSPELVLGTTLDARSDVFGVGVCLYEMVTGRRLFAGSDDIATLKLVGSANVPPPSALVEDTPEDLEMIMMRALERDPDKRWQTAGEMGQALAACIAGDDPTFGTRHLAEFMRDLFGQDMIAEQRRLNDLLAATKDAALMEQRRRFFTSPLGAAAIAKAEAARRVLSTLPPPPQTQQALPALQPQRPPPPPAHALAGKAGPPRDRLTPTDIDPVRPVHSDRSDHGEQSDDELTTFRPEARAHMRTPIAPPDEEELTTFLAPAVPVTAPVTAPVTEPVTQSDDEPTTFQAPELPAKNERSTKPPGLRARAETPEYKQSQDFPAQEVTPVRAPHQPGTTRGFEEENTSFFDAERRSSTHRGDPVSTKVSPPGPFAEEEATHIFFNSEDGIGLPEVLRDVPSVSDQPAPMRLPSAADRPDHLSAAARRAVTKPVARPAEPGPKDSASQTGGRKPFPLAAPAPAGNPPVAWPAFAEPVERGATIELMAPRRNDRGMLLLAGGVILAMVMLALVFKTPLGITLGLRKPTEGAIEVRTVPPMAAAVRLDGIYRGRAPLRLEGVHAGDRMLALEADGYVTVARRVTVQGGETASVNITLEAQPTSAPTP